MCAVLLRGADTFVSSLSLSRKAGMREREKRRIKVTMANIATFGFLLLWTLFLCFAFVSPAAQRGEILYFSLKLSAELIRILGWMCLNFVLVCWIKLLR